MQTLTMRANGASLPMMKRTNRSKNYFYVAGAIVASTIAAFALPACSNGASSSADSHEREWMPIVRAVFAEDQLWLLHIDGSLVSLRPDDSEPKPVATAGKLVEICKSAGRLVTIVHDGRGKWRLQQHRSDGWFVQANVPAEGDTLVALACKGDEDGIVIVTNRRLLEVEGEAIRSVKLEQELQPPLVNGTALSTRETVWVGFNIGEWGGGLRRIDRSSGKVATIEHNRSGELCGGPLNTSCDPVNGIVVAPWNTSCVVAAIGLVHMMAHGRIVEVCDKDVRRLYFKPLAPQPPHGTLDGGEPSSTVAFYGLAHDGNTLWAIGIDGLYRFSGQQAPEFRPLPKFQDKGGYRVSFDVPGIVLVMTDVNQRASMSGAVPIMAVR